MTSVNRITNLFHLFLLVLLACVAPGSHGAGAGMALHSGADVRPSQLHTNMAIQVSSVSDPVVVNGTPSQ